jgi:small subunit ribosomal protein S9
MSRASSVARQSSLLLAPRRATSITTHPPANCRLASNFFPTSPPTRSPDTRPLVLPKPPTQTWFTGKPEYNDALNELQDALHSTRSRLFRAGILHRYDASPTEALEKLNIPLPASETMPKLWKRQEQVGNMLETRLKMLHYRHISQLLNTLDSLKPHAAFADRLGLPYSDGTLENQIEDVLAPYRRQLSDEQKASSGEMRLWRIDDYGRSHAVGRRKESTAKVWVIPVKNHQDTTTDAEKSDKEAVEPAIGQILVNGRPLVDVFPLSHHRLSILQPFTATHTLGRYNVFSITFGGGKTGQADALKVGIARALFGLLEDDQEKRATLWTCKSPPISSDLDKF